MKSTLILILFLVVCFSAFSQTKLEPGRYTSADGYYSFEVRYVPEGLQVTEPTRVNLYIGGADGIYRHSEAKYSKYYIRVVNSKELRTGSGNSNEPVFTWSGPLLLADPENAKLDVECMVVADKYKKLAEEDFETQAWAFCSAAALVKCTSDPEGFNAFARDIVLSLRTMVIDQKKCPCEDVISPALWNKYQLNQ